MERNLLLSLLIIGIPWISANAQLVQNNLKATEKSSVEIGFDYSSNSGTYGIFNSFTAQPNSSPSINYYGAKGMELSVTGLFIGNSNAASLSKGSKEVDLTAGWDFNLLDKAISISPSYSHFIFSSGSATAKSIYSDQTELDISGSFKWFRPSVTTDYLFGTQKALNINITSGFNIKWDNVFAKGNNLEFEPAISTNYGDLSYSSLIAKKLFQFLTPLRTKYGDNITILQLEANGSFTGNKQIQKQLSNLNPTATLGQIFTITNNYQINSIDLSFPFTYTLKNLSLYSGINIAKPMNVPAYIKSQTVVYLSAGLSYSFDL